MGRQAFSRFLTSYHRTTDTERGVRWDSAFATWDELLDRGTRRSELVAPQHAYVVDPSAGIESITSLFAVATVPDTVLLWASVDELGVPYRELAPGLYEVDQFLRDPLERPMWGVATSGSSGEAKLAIGYADNWELIALHYERAMYQHAMSGTSPSVLATCMRLQFSAAFFMIVLPSLFFRRDMVVFPPHDWSSVVELSAEQDVAVLSVPAIAAAACLGFSEPKDMHRCALFLGGGHVTEERMRTLTTTMRGASIANLYGTAEAGAIAVDYAPGHNEHVGRPIAGKSVWLVDRDDQGVGTVAVAGPDCCRYIWRPNVGLTGNDEFVASTDYGRYDEHGNLCLEGRVDGGEKLRGVLVYPRAIERHLLALPGVVDARVLVRRSTSGLEHLVARVVGDVDEGAVRDHCTVLDEAERPSRIECIPESQALSAYNPNGKL